ncbi:hypothetical protein ASPSYDRAFT_39847 [Aspergillus sydowii CBS 593.65]|uniref:Uncharacterized protein n=1 Tax=Aspergillus sydowii CBS 593.65 TaxID=1036612 RepID=A0A1L9U024_9EURO|nr:uncharacterized protein ASPSYDRAFT_39847 [Aspergillus sydowii CBS 593.65]OJJ65050.1 hypothetical protein ASPSYDRAFT_39847 [Aspergillus sydowii CBS 593.65]
MRFVSILAALALQFTLFTPSIFALAEQDKLVQEDDEPLSCHRACFQQKPTCPGKMEPKKLSDCWSCCLPHQPKVAIDTEL